MTEPLEIERKFLIEMPGRAVLDRCPVRWEMWQTYLLAPPGISARVRRRVGETEQFFHTEKLRRTDRTCVEREREITRAEYETLLRQQDPDRVTIHKERYCLPEGGLVRGANQVTYSCTGSSGLTGTTTLYVIVE